MAFQEVIDEAGCKLDSEHVVFTVEPVLFRRALGTKLRSQTNGFEEFSQDLQAYSEDPAVFRKFLLPSSLADNVPKTSRTSTSESLFKTLLAIDLIQPDIITYLLERLPEFYDELENDNSSSCTARLILHQLRWLDYIAQPEALTGKLIEIIQVTPPLIQHELITSLPDMVNDSEHKPIVVYLKELMPDNPNLTVPILDALSNLTLHSESLEDVRESVLGRLESAELDDLAVIVKFLLQTVTPTTIDSVVYGIREKLDFRTLGKLQQMGAAAATQRSDKKVAPEALILESIKLGLQFHKFVCDSWLKSIVTLESQREHKVIDMLVLIILYSMTSMKKKAEVIIKKKIIQGSITSALIQETIMCHADGIVGYWSSLLSLSESLLRSCQQNSAVSPCASILYISSFKSSDAYYRQEIIGALVTHIGSGVEAEMNVALNVLLQLVKSNVSSIAVYSVFVKGILDYLDNLNLYQIRTLFDIFSLLAITSGNSNDGSGNLWDEIQIVVRKQLSNPREKYKKIGIIATLSAVKVLGNRKLCTDQSNAGSSSLATGSSQAETQVQNVVRHPYLRQATSLLGTMLRFTSENPNCVAMVYDELAHIFTEEDIDHRLQVWIRENMTSDFTEFYLLSEDDGDRLIQQYQNDQFRRLEPEKMMNMDTERLIVVNMYPIIYDTDLKTKRDYMVPMCSIFNLIQSSEKNLKNGSLEEVDALFGCGIIMFKTEELDDITTEETEYACDILFYTINWFKELLNAFMYVKEEERYRERLIARLRHILQLENLLSHLMKKVPRYTPLEFHTTVPVTSTKGSAPEIISTPATVESQNLQETQHSEVIIGHKAVKKDHKASSVVFASMDDLRIYMRPFYVHILEILKYNGEVEDIHDKMTYDEINYVLADLVHKLDIKITPPAPVIFGKKKDTAEDKYPSSNGNLLARIDSQNLMKKIVAYLPHILQTLESIYVDIQSRDIEPGRTEYHKDVSHSISLVFNVIYKLLSWPEIQNSDNVAILHGIIHCISQRISGDGKQKKRSCLESELLQAFQYFSQYADNIPESKTAVLLFNVLQRLMVISENPTAFRKTALKVAHQIVTTDWFDVLEIQKDIPYLIEEWITLNDDSLDVILDLIANIIPAYEENGKLEEYPLLNSKTLVPHYQAIVSQTAKSFDLLKETNQEVEIVLAQTARIVMIFERITNYVKQKEDKTLMGVLLKTGRLFIDQFLKHSIPYFTKVFKSHTNSVVGIFKEFQSSTRTLQAMCSHVKVLKEVSLSQYVPPLKRDLETVIYQVKMLLTENRLSSNVFYMGALKHRDMRGAEVSSQIPREEYEDEDEDIDSAEGENAENANVKIKKRTSKKPATASSRKRINKPASTGKPRSKSKLATSVTARLYRTSSIVPSSADEDDDEEETPLTENEVEEAEEEEEEEEDVEELTEEEAVAISSIKNKRNIAAVQEAEEEDDLEDINVPESSDEEEEEEGSNEMDEDEDNEMPSIPSSESASPPPTPEPKRKEKEQPTKKRRLGIGSFRSSQKIFNLTGSNE